MNTPNIPGWTRLEECPITIGCVSKVVWRDADNNYYRLDNRLGEFVPHICHVRGSAKPKVAYLGEWVNIHTQRTRWQGPKRLERSARKRPVDAGTQDADWQLVGVYVAELKWKKL